MEGRSTQMVQISGNSADRNELCTNAGWPCHRWDTICHCYQVPAPKIRRIEKSATVADSQITIEW